MDLILNENEFKENEIIIKKCKNNQKILYHQNGIYLIGIPLKIENYIIVHQTNKYLTLNISKSKQYDVLKKIDEYFHKKNLNFYF